jgi:hypothetical protein
MIVLEHGYRAAGVRLAFQFAPGSDLCSARLPKGESNPSGGAEQGKIQGLPHNP